MRRHLRVLAIALAAPAVLGAALAAAQFVSTWKSPEITRLNFAGKKVAALIISDDMNLRMSGEEALASELTARGVQGVGAYRLIPAEELKDKAKARVWFERAQLAGIVVMRVLADQETVDNSPVRFASNYYTSFYDYYGYAWGGVVTFGGSPTRERALAIEVLIFQAESGQLVWASTSEKTNPKSLGALVGELVSDVVKEMAKEGLVPKGAR